MPHVLPAPTASLVSKIKRTAKARSRTGSSLYSEQLEAGAVDAGYSSWHALQKAAAAHADSRGAALDLIPLDPKLPRNFEQTPNDERSPRQLKLWWEKPYAETLPDGRLQVRCLDSGAWDRPTWYGIAANIEEATALAAEKLEWWRSASTRPSLVVNGDGTADIAVLHTHPHRPMEVLQAGIVMSNWSDGLAPNEFLVLSSLRLHADKHSQLVSPSMDTLIKETKLTRAAVHKTLRQLEDKGRLTMENPQRGQVRRFRIIETVQSKL